MDIKISKDLVSSFLTGQKMIGFELLLHNSFEIYFESGICLFVKNWNWAIINFTKNTKITRFRNHWQDFINYLGTQINNTVEYVDFVGEDRKYFQLRLSNEFVLQLYCDDTTKDGFSAFGRGGRGNRDVLFFEENECGITNSHYSIENDKINEKTLSRILKLKDSMK